MPSTLHEVVSVCAKKDLSIWSMVAKYLPQYIPANHYSVYVPDSELKKFKEITNPDIEVCPESSLIGGLSKVLFDHLAIENRDRFGWYLQQLIKIAAIYNQPKDATVLIWDADTLPLKPLSFVNQHNVLELYSSSEYRSSYFDFIERILNLKKISDRSFIAQCMPVRAYWIHEMASQIESRYSDGWLKSLIMQIDPKEPAGFSEYETIGTFIAHKYPDAWYMPKRSWCRNGVSLIGSPQYLSRFELRGLAKEYDFISFERWDRPRGIKHLFNIAKNKLFFYWSGLIAKA